MARGILVSAPFPLGLIEFWGHWEKGTGLDKCYVTYKKTYKINFKKDYKTRLQGSIDAIAIKNRHNFHLTFLFDIIP